THDTNHHDDHFIFEINRQNNCERSFAISWDYDVKKVHVFNFHIYIYIYIYILCGNIILLKLLLNVIIIFKVIIEFVNKVFILNKLKY
ncbi:hypothetical protein ACMBCM_05545, partial [Spiroplasma sp. K1]